VRLRINPSASNNYVDIETLRGQQRVYLSGPQLRKLQTIATSPQLEPGVLWRVLSDIPLERPLPSRSLEEELRLLLIAYTTDGR
jgi:hypothetical protein